MSSALAGMFFSTGTTCSIWVSACYLVSHFWNTLLFCLPWFYSLYTRCSFWVLLTFPFVFRFFFNMDHFKSLYWIYHNIASVLYFGFLASRCVGSEFPDRGSSLHPLHWKVKSAKEVPNLSFSNWFPNLGVLQCWPSTLFFSFCFLADLIHPYGFKCHGILNLCFSSESLLWQILHICSLDSPWMFHFKLNKSPESLQCSCSWNSFPTLLQSPPFCLMAAYTGKQIILNFLSFFTSLS